MTKFHDKHRIESHRLKGWNYGSNGFYVVTICTENKRHYFGKIKASIEDPKKIIFTKTSIAEIAFQFWIRIPEYFDFVYLDEFIVMPNHIHGILLIDKFQNPPEEKSKFGTQKKNLSEVIRSYKARVKKYAGEKNIEFKWQRGFFDRVIRSENELNNFRQYIKDNPDNWLKDKNYTDY